MITTVFDIIIRSGMHEHTLECSVGKVFFWMCKQIVTARHRFHEQSEQSVPSSSPAWTSVLR